MSKEQFPNKIIWLASYPKSGNTWCRAFLSALLGGGEVEINDLKTDAIFSSREIFERISDIDSHDLYEEEISLIQPEVFRQLAAEQNRTCIIKVHDAFIYNTDKQPIIPEDVTHCAVYLIRNPLDVVGSFANHNGDTIDATIKLMNNPNGSLAKYRPRGPVNNQTKQLMFDWSGHVKSWTTDPRFPVHVVRYEDMLADSFGTFKKLLQDIGWNYDDELIQKAINASSFNALSDQEKAKGFREKNSKSKVFFRGGKMGNWKNELTQEQADLIINSHKEVMEQFNYLPV